MAIPFNKITWGDIVDSFTDAKETAQSIVQPVTNSIGDIKDAFTDAKEVVQEARETIREPLNNTLAKVGQIAYKAAPTAFAASASVQYLGGTPSFASFLQPWNLRSKYLLVAADRHTTIGWPCERFETLNTLSGFVMCEQVGLEIPGTATASGATLEEQQLIKQYLENGCFIE